MAVANFERTRDGRLASFTSIGCYPIFYVTKRGTIHATKTLARTAASAS